MQQIKSGKEILDDFFNNLGNIPNVDKKMAESLTGLYRSGKLTQKALSNALLEQRKEGMS